MAYRPRPLFFASSMLGVPGGFRGGNGVGLGAGGSSLSRTVFSALIRGDSGKRSAAIVWRSCSAMIALSSGERSLIGGKYVRTATKASQSRNARLRPAAIAG